jgi:surfeit locus 1 family protein
MNNNHFPLWLRAIFLSAIPIVFISMLALGFWQLSRLQERRAQNALILSRTEQLPVALETLLSTSDWSELNYRTVTVRGVFDATQEIFWKNQAYNGAPGFHVITPLRISGTEAVVLVDRGWVPYGDGETRREPAYAPPTVEVVLTGQMRVPAVRSAALSPQDRLPTDGSPLTAWFWLDTRVIQAQMPYALLPVILHQTPEAGPATRFPIADLSLQLDDGPHLSYAVQWFSFATIALVGPLIYWWNTKRRK